MADQSGKIDSEGPANRPHTITTKPSDYPSDTVIATEDSGRQEELNRKTVPDFHANVHVAELLLLAPQLGLHVTRAHPQWADIANAASNGLRHDLGVSDRLWGEACLAMGRPLASVALAIVSTKPREHFTHGASGYFAAMMKRAKTGELNLDRSLWKLRRDHLDRIDQKLGPTCPQSAFRRPKERECAMTPLHNYTISKAISPWAQEC